MKIFGWGRGEHRAESYTQDRTAQGYAAAETAVVDASHLAVVESCVALIADPFLGCRIQGYPISPISVHQMGRDVLRCGNSVWAINTNAGELRLQRVAKYEVSGDSPDPEDWIYDVELRAPKATIKRRLPGASVVHIRLNPSSDQPWVGVAPWQSADLTSGALVNLERSIREEGNLAAGRIWTAPDGSSPGQLKSMASSIAALRGGFNVVAESTSQNFGQGGGRGQPSPGMDWKPNSTGPNFPQANVLMRAAIEGSLANAYGIPASWFNVDASAPSLRETKRLSFLNKTLTLAALLEEELSEKLAPLSIHWDDLASQSIDVHLRARAIQPLAELGANKEELLRLVGLPLTVEAQGQASGEEIGE